MGIQDRDYWRDKYLQRSRTGSADPTHWREDELRPIDSTQASANHDFRQRKCVLLRWSALCALLAVVVLAGLWHSGRLPPKWDAHMRQLTIFQSLLATDQAKHTTGNASLPSTPKQVQISRAEHASVQEPALSELAQARKEAAWQAFYQPEAICLQDATVACANAYIRAKRAFEAQYRVTP